MEATAAEVHLVSLWPWPLASDLENLFSNGHLHDEHCAKFHWNPSSKWRDIASCRMRIVLTDGPRTEGWQVGRQSRKHTSSSAIVERPRCMVDPFWSKCKCKMTGLLCTKRRWQFSHRNFAADILWEKFNFIRKTATVHLWAPFRGLRSNVRCSS